MEPDTRTQLYEQAQQILARLVSNDDAQFHPGQFEAIEALVAQRRRALVVQRTGWGKSAVYFVSALLLRAQGAGPTLIISPLLSLMRDQVAAAQRAGVRAAALNSANATEWELIDGQLRNDEIDVLLISPERLNNPVFRDTQLPVLLKHMGMLVVDEAHCISDWGHDFRPDYRRIRDLIHQLASTQDASRPVPILATTATANQRVVDDVVEQLAVASEHDVFVLRGALARSSLRLGVLRLASPAQRLAWLLTNLNDLPGSGIIYCLTVASADDTARALREAGYPVEAYTGGTDPEQRAELEQALKNNEVKALVATSALGMGFDKPDLGFVIHLGAPSSPVAYYQQVGRAGRGTDHADVLLMPGQEDREIWRFFATSSMPDEASATAVLTQLSSPDAPLSLPALESRVDLRRTNLELLLKILAVDGAAQRVSGGWQATGRPWVYDGERYGRVAAERVAEEKLMLDYEHTTGCRMQFLTGVLDDPHASACGRCDNCAGAWYPTDVDSDAAEQAKDAMGRVGVEIQPRKMWPTGMPRLGVDLRGRIPETQQAGSGRAVARFTDVGWGHRLREMLYHREDVSVDRGADRPMIDSVVKVLAQWDWEQRPAAVIAVPSAHRQQLIRSVAEAISEIGKLPLLGELSYRMGPPSGGPGGNSAFRLSRVHGQFLVSDILASRLAETYNNGATGPVLLVDDMADSRWTLTECARVLRQAGAPGVLPFVLATVG